MTKKTNSPQKKASGGGGRKASKSSWLNLFNRNHKWEDKDEVLDAVYWSRQILAIFMGVIWGIIGLTGIVGISLFVLTNSIAAYGIANNTGYEFEPDENFLSVKEGFMTTFATFLVSWIVTYTAYHF